MDYDFVTALEAIARTKNIEEKILYDALEAGLSAAGRKMYGEEIQISTQIDHEEGQIYVWLTKTVVEEVENESMEISLEDALYLAGDEVIIGDELDIELDIEDFGRTAAQTAKQVVMQRIREAERDKIFDEFKAREDTLINGIVQGEASRGTVIDLGRTDGILPFSESVPGENYRKGDRIKAYVVEVRKTSRSPQIILSRKHSGLVADLFAQEIPEIADGTVVIVAIARDAGFRSKVAVRSTDPNVDAVGTCVGLKGYRIQSIVRELEKERVDLVLWSKNPLAFAKHAFNPIEVLHVEYDEPRDRIMVVVPDDKLSIAIGKGGRNIKLASRLVGQRIDVRNQEQFDEEKAQFIDSDDREDAMEELQEIPGVGHTTAEQLYEGGYDTIESIALATTDELTNIPGVGEATADKLRAAAEKFLAEEAAAEAAEEAADESDDTEEKTDET